MRIRRGDGDDTPVVIDLFDQAVEWLVARGRSAQWGDEPYSRSPDKVRRVRELIESADLWLAGPESAPEDTAGALVLSEEPMDYVAPVDERELYVRLLLTSRRHAGSGVGGTLLDHARAVARERGIGLLRVDCWAGGDGALIDYYINAGFTPTHRVPVRDTEVQVFEQRLDA